MISVFCLKLYGRSLFYVWSSIPQAYVPQCLSCHSIISSVLGKKLLKTRKYSDKCLKILEEFKNENHLAANSRVLRVHLLSPEGQCITTKIAEVCNFLYAFILP